MNAGCYGVGNHGTCVAKVLTVSRGGKLSERSPGDFATGYRRVELRGSGWARTSGSRCLVSFSPATRNPAPPPGHASKSCWEAHRGAAARASECWLGYSVTRPATTPGRLVEASGLKGHEIGGARISRSTQISSSTRGKARAADIEALIEHPATP